VDDAMEPVRVSAISAPTKKVKMKMSIAAPHWAYLSYGKEQSKEARLFSGG
jgi:hypothetical protein